MENPEAGIDESKHGTLLVEGDKYRLTIAGQIVISDGETLWTWLVEDDEVMVNFIEDDDETITPSNLLTSYSDNYKSKFVKESVQNGKTVDIIDLTPLQGKTYSKIRIVIDKNKIQLLSFTIYDKNGSTYSYLINKFLADVEINESEFTFNPEKHPNVEVVDMR
jgi:outer membrane lipoprotein-sorting protein